MIRGSIVALVTPFNVSGGVDYGALENLIEFHVTEGTHAIVAVGTTGESATLSHSEDNEVIKATVEYVGGRIPVIAGAGSNSTAEACQLTEAATRAGADAILSVAPYYNKPPQNGLLAHFKAVADSTDLPIILYNVPGRTVTDIADETTLNWPRWQTLQESKTRPVIWNELSTYSSIAPTGSRYTQVMIRLRWNYACWGRWRYFRNRQCSTTADGYDGGASDGW